LARRYRYFLAVQRGIARLARYWYREGGARGARVIRALEEIQRDAATDEAGFDGEDP